VSNVLENLRYTSEHEYVELDDNGLYVIGITDYAQGELGDVVFVNLPKTGEKFDEHQAFGVVEAVKAVSDLYCPVAGEMPKWVENAVNAVPGVSNTSVVMTFDPPWDMSRVSDEARLALNMF